MGALGPDVSAIGLGCMGMSFAYGERDDAELDADPATARSTSGVNHLDTADMYGCGAQRGAARPGRPGAAGRGLPRHEVRQPRGTPTAQPAVIDSSSAAWAREACDASLARLGIDTIDLYYMHRRNPDDPDRGDGRGDGGPGRRRQGPAHRPVRDQRGDAAGRARRAPDHGRADGVLAVQPGRRRGRDAGDLPGARAWRWWRTRRSGAACSPARSRRGPTLADGDFRGAGAAVQRREPGRQPDAGRAGRRRSPPRSAARRPRRRWPGCSPRATTSCRSRAPSGCRYLEENAAAADLALTPAPGRGRSRRRCRWTPWPATATRPAGCATSATDQAIVES